MSNQKSTFIWVTGALIACSMTGCFSPHHDTPVLTDRPQSEFQGELLDAAFEVASAIPVTPHLKGRSRLQEQVVEVALELDQPNRALSFADQIGNWRRGAAYADCALYSIQHGVTDRVAGYLELADQIALTADQDWRRDQIRSRISQTYYLMGQNERSAQLISGLEMQDVAKLEQINVAALTPAELDAQLLRLSELIDSRDFDLVKNSLFVCVKLYERFYDDEKLRLRAEEKIHDSWSTLPYTVRIELLMKLAEVAREHDDSAHALRWVNEAREMVTGVTWPAQYQVPLTAVVAEMRYRCGDQVRALAEMDEALALFRERQSEIINIYKAESLLPVAEAFFVADNIEKSHEVYQAALTASIENPNSFPQAEDLSAICLSMAQHQVAPSAELWSRIQDVQHGLGNPW